MPIKFKAIERGEPGVAGGGTKKYYAVPVVSGEMDLDALTTAIEKISTASGADIRAVLYALVDVSVGSITNGNIVRLGDLGSIRVSISSEGREKEEEVTSACIKSRSIIFTPGPRIKKELEQAKFQKTQ